MSRIVNDKFEEFLDTVIEVAEEEDRLEQIEAELDKLSKHLDELEQKFQKAYGV
jgi:vacuolar-type H+-ATPase subunit D/Vma8